MKIDYIIIYYFSLLFIISNGQNLAHKDFLEERLYSEFQFEPKKLFNESMIIKDTGNKIFDDSKTQKDIINKMGFGWNLGNTLDAFKLDDFSAYDPYSEGRWGMPKTTEEMIKEIKRRGFNSIRIPVSWHNHLIDENYTIDPNWMSHTKEIVNWALKYDLIVILNSHHDNAKLQDNPINYRSGYFPANKDREESERFLYNIWSQISIAYNNGYDQNLIFECMNEPRPEKSTCEWTYKKGDSLCEEATSCINEYNKICLKAIRESGGNNEKRFILVTGLAAQYHNLIKSDFVFPSDKKYNPNNNKIMLSVHMYFPYDFAANPDMNKAIFDDRIKDDFYAILRNLYDKYVLRGYNVIVGEMGCVNKNNTQERVKWANFYIQTTRRFQIGCLIWDNGGFNNKKSANEVFGLFHRKELKWEPEELVSALVDSSKTELSDNPEEIYDENIISAPVTFKDWKFKIYVDYIKFSGYNSFCKLTFTKIDTDPVTNSISFKISYADWTSAVYFNQSNVEGANLTSGGSIAIAKGVQNVKIFLNNSFCNLVQSKGLVFDGTGLIITNVHISGPRFVKIEPKTINRSSQTQKLKIYFNEDASPLSGNIILTNFYYDINKQIECKVSNEDKKIIICEGIYNFTGEFFFKDINDYSLTNKFLRVVPKQGEKYNINNLIEEKIIFDYSELDKSIYLSKDLFKEVNTDSKLTIETTDLNFNPAYKNLNLFRGKSNSIIKFNSKDVNTTVNGNGSIIVPAGRKLIVIDIKDHCDIFKNEGVTIKGIGFGLNSIYLNEKIDISDDSQKNENDEGGISGWVIFLIIIIVILAIGLSIYLFFHFRNKSIESEIDSTFDKKEKMMN